MAQWPKTSDKEFSKRVCRTFMWAYFIQILVTLGMIFFIDDYASTLLIDIFRASNPAYMLVFGAVIAKSGVENIAKGKTTAKTSSKTAATTANAAGVNASAASEDESIVG